MNWLEETSDENDRAGDDLSLHCMTGIAERHWVQTLKKITVITGGAGGMGLATAKVMARDHEVVISDVSPQRLEKAAGELRRLGIACEPVACDVTDPDAVDALIARSSTLGKLVSVIHTAGVSPQMANARTIMQVNALGTANITSACLKVASSGFALVNVASMAAYLIPAMLLPKRAYHIAQMDPERFVDTALRLCRWVPGELYRNGLAYGISKNFVVWLSKRSAAKFGEKGARILSVSPGSFDTEMGRLEETSGSAEMLKSAALKRFGKPQEIGELLSFCASDKAGYLTGVDILCDGGVIAARQQIAS